MEYLKFLGVPSALYMLFFMIVSFRANKDYSLRKNPISQVADSDFHSRFFNTSMLLNPFIRTAYYLPLAIYFSFRFNWIIYIVIVVDFAACLLTAIFTTGKYHKLHHNSALAMFFIFIPTIFFTRDWIVIKK